MPRRIRPLLTTFAVTAALAGGGAAIASAATSTSSASGTGTTAPAAHAAHTPPANARSGSHNCPNM
jgi:hypothetical protein